MQLLARSQIEHGAEDIPLAEFEVQISDELLVAAGYPVPVKNGDIVEVAGMKGTVRLAPQIQWKGQKVYRCRCEALPA